MKNILSPNELIDLIKTVFSPKSEDKHLAILVDVPDERFPDLAHWKQRRNIAFEWYSILNKHRNLIDLESINLFFFQNVHSNNADLPNICFKFNEDYENVTYEHLQKDAPAFDFNSILSQQQIIIAPTQFSATAPLKVLAKRYGFRAATLPGFSTDMIPALRLNWNEVNKRVNQVKKLLDRATFAKIEFSVHEQETCHLQLDLRFRQGHASGGFLHSPGIAGNLPSGESYIVPYEGEKNEPSYSEGILPVQFGEEIVKYRIKKNKAVEIISEGKKSFEEYKLLSAEPAYGNLAELGFGVLEPFGIEPIGSILLDEKLGLHIAFGRSDHFGGAVGVNDFKDPENVVHIDRIYIKETQPNIQIKTVKLIDEEETSTVIMKDNNYLIF